MQLYTKSELKKVRIDSVSVPVKLKVGLQLHRRSKMLNTLAQLIGLALVMMGAFYGERFLARKLAEKPYVQRFKIWRDQLLILVGLTFTAVLLHFVGLHFPASLATVASKVALIWFVRENIDNYVVSSQTGKSTLKLISYMFIILILVQAIF